MHEAFRWTRAVRRITAACNIDEVKSLRDPALFREAAFVGNRWVAGGESISVSNPATGAEVGRVPSLGADETNEAIAAAAAAFPEWRAASAAKRAELLEAWHDAMMANVEDLARIMTLEQGKPLAESRGEVRYGAGFVKWFSEEA